MTDLSTLATQLRDLHRPGDPLVLVNAWDVASAHGVVAAGGKAIGTTSAAIAGSLGIPDGPDAPLDLLFDAIARIAGAVDVPVTADVLDGYGLDADKLVDRLLSAGAVGCNIEDSDHRHPGTLLEPALVADRLRDVRAAASAAGVDLVINARVDCFIHMADPTAALEEIVRRAALYASAGADCIYPVRLTEPDAARKVVHAVDVAVNGNWRPGGSLPDLAAAGVRRISVGPQAQGVALAALDQFARSLFGT